VSVAALVALLGDATAQQPTCQQALIALKQQMSK
jgi:hypothetical protein